MTKKSAHRVSSVANPSDDVIINCLQERLTTYTRARAFRISTRYKNAYDP